MGVLSKVGFCPALVAVPYAAKKRHTSLPPPQPLGILSLMIWIGIIDKVVFELLQGNFVFLKTDFRPVLKTNLKNLKMF